MIGNPVTSVNGLVRVTLKCPARTLSVTGSIKHGSRSLRVSLTSPSQMLVSMMKSRTGTYLVMIGMGMNFLTDGMQDVMSSLEDLGIDGAYHQDYILDE